MDLYISAGDVEPTEFKNDFEVKRQTYLQLSSVSFPIFTTFVAAIRVYGFDTYDQTYIQSKLRVSFEVDTSND